MKRKARILTPEQIQARKAAALSILSEIIRDHEAKQARVNMVAGVQRVQVSSVSA